MSSLSDNISNQNSQALPKKKYEPTKLYSCKLCHYRSTHISNVRRHITNHLPKRLCCLHCDYKTNRPDTLKVHVKKKHLQKQ